MGIVIEDREKAAKDLGIYIQSQKFLATHFNIRMEDDVPNPEDLYREAEKRLLVRIHPTKES